jgi:hypothetical protein
MRVGGLFLVVSVACVPPSQEEDKLREQPFSRLDSGEVKVRTPTWSGSFSDLSSPWLQGEPLRVFGGQREPFLAPQVTAAVFADVDADGETDVVVSAGSSEDVHVAALRAYGWGEGLHPSTCNSPRVPGFSCLATIWTTTA